jgi:multidrug efflux pump subunit AcrA (membrane-fusion protein)
MKSSIPALLLIIAGLAIMVVAALAYLFDWEIKHPSFGLGLVFAASGVVWAKKAKAEKNS